MSALALPSASVVMLARDWHGDAWNRLHTAVLKVWFAVVPVRVMCAVVPFTTMAPLPGAKPVVCCMPPVIVAAGSSADWKDIPEDPVDVAPTKVLFVSMSANIPE